MVIGNKIDVTIGLGNDNVFKGPRKRLEINTGPQSSDPSLAASGLMFRDLTSVSPVTTNPGPGVLAVDINGNVIYVPGNNSPAIGNNCGATPQNPLTANFEIPMNGFNYTFSDPASLNYGQNTVRVGAACNNPPFTAKFEVFRLPTTFPSGVTSLIGIGSLNRDKYSSPSPGNNAYAGYYVCSGGNAASPSNYANYGIAGYGLNARINYGGYFEAITPFTLNYGVYAKAIQDGSSYAGYFEGDVFINGIGSGTGGVFAPSDSRLKTNIDTISNALAIINQMKPREFYYDTANVYGINFNNKKQYGFIAQDLEPILPELIGYTTKPQVLDTLGNLVTDSLKYKTVNYTAIIGLLTKAIQEQQVKIDSLTQSANTKDSIQDARLTALENAIAQCCSNNNARTNNSSGQAVGNQLNVELSDKDAIVLNQNVPNPFAEQTTITYNVPQNVGKAQLLFYNSNGQLIQSVDIKTRGKGKVNVFASDLSSGLYHYTLVADGKVVDSKKMVRE